MPNSIHLILKAEDADLHGWKASLPHRTLNKTVNEILLAESKSEIAAIPFEFSSIENSKPLSCVIRVTDEKVARFVSNLPKGEVMESVKKIIRKHIRKNKEMPQNEVGIPAELLAAKIEEFRQLLVANADLYVGEHDKNRKIKSIYIKLINKFFNNILDCYRWDDEEKCDCIFQNLEIEKLVGIEFLLMFDEIFKLLQLGIPDEEFETILTQMREKEKKYE